MSMNWDDLRVVAAVQAAGSYAKASLQLGINETTVSRRLERIEDALGYRLFHPRNGRRNATVQCRLLLDEVAQISQHINRIQIMGRDQSQISGLIRIALTAGVAEHIVSPHLVDLMAAHPQLKIHLDISGDNVQFSQWEADLAVRLNKPESGNFKIRKLGTFDLYFVAPKSDDSGIIAGYTAALDFTPESRALAELDLGTSPQVETDNLNVIRKMIESGRASGILPHMMVREFLESPNFAVQKLDMKREAWLLIQPHLTEDRTTRCVIDWLGQVFSAERL
ncbi:MAG: LysR family transcriptional regulator [Rhodobacteraceae bacterium]|nr:LysR family transcriptional regulator [Paracoccaceae bacterium]